MIKIKLKTKKSLIENSIPNYLYHGGPKKFDKFDPNKSNYRSLTYFTTDINFAKSFAGGRGLEKGYLYTVTIDNSLNLFDATQEESPDKLKPIILKLISEKYKDPVTGLNFDPSNQTIFLNGEQIKNPSGEQYMQHLIWRLKNGSWRLLENEKILQFIKELGYGGLITVESNTKNIGIFPEYLGSVNIIKVEEIDVNPD